MTNGRMKYFLYLNRLRESGVVNMFGAAEYVENDFDLDRKEAVNILIAWMKWVEETPGNRDL